MSVKELIENKIRQTFNPTYFEVVNESMLHGASPKTESHFRVVIISTAFEGRTKIQQHRLVNESLYQELTDHIHALVIQTDTPAHWESLGKPIHVSAPCPKGHMVK